jgi:hypothetical protein
MFLHLVLTQPIAGSPEAVGFARVSPKQARKRLTFGQYTHYNLLLSNIKVSPTVFYFGRFMAFLQNFTSSLLLQ